VLTADEARRIAINRLSLAATISFDVNRANVPVAVEIRRQASIASGR
jgi:hypothetical protein